LLRVEIEKVETEVIGQIEAYPSLGVLHLNGTEQWIPLDGYHRLYWILESLLGLSGNQKQRLEQVDLPVILIFLRPTDDIKGIIRRLHKSARTLDKGETIRQAHNDVYAIYADWLIGKDRVHHIGVLSEDLVNWKSNTLTHRLRKFTTLSVLYDSAKILAPNAIAMTLKDIIEGLNKLSWEMDNPLWKNLIVVDGRINASARAISLTSNFIAYYIGVPRNARYVHFEKSITKQKVQVKKRSHNHFGYKLWLLL
jgi:hypothetical protein